MLLLRVPRVVRNELFVWADGCPNHYSLLLLILLMPQAHLHAWFGTLIYEGTGGNPRLPHNLCHYLESYLWQHYTSLSRATEEDIYALLGV